MRSGRPSKSEAQLPASAAPGVSSDGNFAAVRKFVGEAERSMPMADHPRESDPKGVNPSGQGPAQPTTVDSKDKRQETKQPGAASANPRAEADADADTYD
jgi:hypothetical protein